MAEGRLGAAGKLDAKLIHIASPGKEPVRYLKVPGLGRLLFSRDPKIRVLPNDLFFVTHLWAHHTDAHGHTKGMHDLGPGLTTQSLALALANEPFSVANASALKTLGYMSGGTGVTAATAYDYQLQTAAGPVSTLVTPTGGLAADNATLQWVGTINYVSTLAITEFGLFAGTGTLTSTGYTTTAANAFTSTTMTPTSSQAWTVNTYAGMYVCAVASATPAIGLVVSNTATALTIQASGWAQQNATGGTDTTPSANTSAVLVPLMADHKIFGAINVISGDSIQFTYTLSCASGG